MKKMFLALLLSLPLATPALADEFPTEWTALGITAGMPYAKAKRLLVDAGWQPDAPDAGSPAAFHDFPEVECGQGRDAVCSAGFRKGDEQVAMLVGSTQAGQPFVQGTY